MLTLREIELLKQSVPDLPKIPNQEQVNAQNRIAELESAWAPTNTFGGRTETLLEKRRGESEEIQRGLEERKIGVPTAAIQGVGNVIGAAFDIAGELPVIKQGLELFGSGIQKLSETKPIKEIGEVAEPITTKLVNWYQSLSSENQRSVRAVGNILSVIPIGKGVSETGKFLEKGVEKGISKISERIIPKIKTNLTEKAMNSLERSYQEIPLPAGVIKAEAQTGKDFAKFMSEKPEYTLKVDRAEKWDTWGTAQKLREEAKAESKAVSSILEGRTERISEDKLISEAKSLIADISAGQERKQVENYIENEIKTLIDQYGKGTVAGANGERLISVIDANKIKQLLWDRSPFQTTASRADKLRSSVDYKMGQTFRKNIEEVIDDVDIQRLNTELGDYYSAIEILEKLHGNPAKGGRLGIGFARLVGAITGAQGGAIGSLVGYLAADSIAKWLLNPEFTTGLKRYVLRELGYQRPKVAKEVEAILKKQDIKMFETLKLQEPETVFVPPTQEGKPFTPNRQGFQTTPAVITESKKP